MIIQLNDTNIDGYLEEYGDDYLLIDFWASRCEICRYNAFIADELAHDPEKKVVVGKVNVDKSPYTVAKFQISVIPSMVLIQGKKRIHEFMGVASTAEILNTLNRIMES